MTPPKRGEVLRTVLMPLKSAGAYYGAEKYHLGKPILVAFESLV
jgi:hypothetical protein